VTTKWDERSFGRAQFVAPRPSAFLVNLEGHEDAVQDVAVESIKKYIVRGDPGVAETRSPQKNQKRRRQKLRKGIHMYSLHN